MKFFITAIIAALLIACNSNEDKPADSKDAGHDAHASTASVTSTEIPLPEVPAGARVFFANLKDGQVVSSPLKVEMGVEGMAVDSMGKIRPASGHHHILVDIDSIPTKTIVPPTDSLHHYHYGKAQTSGEIKLTPGKHFLVLQFADGAHRSYGSRLTSKVNIEVKQ
jgi:hypothetical protein